MRTEFWQVRMLTARTKQQGTLMFSCHLVSPNQDLVSFRKRNHRSMGQGQALEDVQDIWVRLNNQSYLPVLMSLSQPTRPTNIRSCIQWEPQAETKAGRGYNLLACQWANHCSFNKWRHNLFCRKVQRALISPLRGGPFFSRKLCFFPCFVSFAVLLLRQAIRTANDFLLWLMILYPTSENEM